MLTHIYVGSHSYDPSTLEQYAQEKAKFHKLEGQKATDFIKELHEEKIAKGEFYAALERLAQKLAQHPIGSRTKPDAFDCSYFLSRCANPSVAVLLWHYGDDANDGCDFDAVEGQGVNDLRSYTHAVMAVCDAPLADTRIPDGFNNLYEDFSPEIQNCVAIKR